MSIVLIVIALMGIFPDPPMVARAVAIKSESEGESPKAVLSGPADKKAGQLVIIETAGSVGTKYSIKCSPENKDWKVVRFEEGDKRDLGIIFSTTEPREYHFFLVMADDKGNLSTAVWMVTILPATPAPPVPVPVPPGPTPGPKPPVPTPGPDVDPTLLAALTTAYNLDLTSGGGTPNTKAALSRTFRVAAKVTALDKQYQMPQQIWTKMHSDADAVQGMKNALPKLRTELSKQQALLLKNVLINGNSTPLNDDVRASISAVLTKMADALDAIP